MINRLLLGGLSARGRSRALTVFIFHRVLEAPDPMRGDEPDRRTFDARMGWIAESFNVIRLTDAIRLIEDGALPPRAACITFDDGYRDNFTLALPIMRKHGLPFTVFVASGFVDGPNMWNDRICDAVAGSRQNSLELDWADESSVLPVSTTEQRRIAAATVIRGIKYLPQDQRNRHTDSLVAALGGGDVQRLMLNSNELRQLAADDLVTIGAHTISHPLLSQIDSHTARREIAESKRMLEDLTNSSITLFAYPNGRRHQDYTAEHVDLVKSLGFDAAVATNWGVLRGLEQRFEIPRFTPWDSQRWKFNLRLAQNYLRA